MKILVVSSEVAPFSKTGGLADVAGSLPPALSARGHDVRVISPRHRCVDDEKFHLLPILGDIRVSLPAGEFAAGIMKTVLPGCHKVPAYFVQNQEFFDRDGLYQMAGEDYPDNHLRFAFFCKAVVWFLKGIDWIPDIIQCNDWQSALLPVMLRTDPDMLADGALQRARVLLTIHNLAFQGVLDREQAAQVGIGPSLFHPAALEFYGKANVLKGGLVFADALSTVSPTYAREIQTPEFGCGLDGVLRERADQLTGILNGIDYAVWNPETDPHLPEKYGPRKMAGKKACKAALQHAAGLKPDETAPLAGIVTRLDSQKGIDLVVAALDEIVATGLQVVILGTGAPEYHDLLTKAARRHKGRLSVNLRFDDAFAHLIEGGADMFLMPSRFEPCGLSQLYSLKYGTIPVVRATGGLADSITDATTQSVESGDGTGFVFINYTTLGLASAVNRAVADFRVPTIWKRIVRNAMGRDFSWDASAAKYDQLMHKIIQ